MEKARMNPKTKSIWFGGWLVGILAMPSLGHTQEIGSVDKAFQWLGPNHKIVVEAFDDPKIDGVIFYVSRSRTGGNKGGLGLAEDTSDASLACRQTGPITIKEKFKEGEEVFTERRSLVFKKLRVVRFLDQTRSTLVYLVYSDRKEDEKKKKSVSAVAMMPWGDKLPKTAP